MSRYRQIIVHAGFSKTGTSSIQDGCYAHRDVLLQHGIVYPRFHFGEHVFITHSIPLTAAIARHPARYGVLLAPQFAAEPGVVIDSLRTQWQRMLQAPQGETLLLSTELIEGFDERDMTALREWLAPHAQRLRVVAFVRSPESGLSSLLQERIKMGGLPDPWALVGRTRQKLENLQRHFPQALETVNFHAASQHPLGLVGAFLSLAGMPGAALAGLRFNVHNERLSMEAYGLMRAINTRYPPREQAAHGVVRRPRDLDALAQLPGPPFEVPDFAASGLLQASREEAAWLEAQLGFSFPRAQPAAPPLLWQDDTLAVLEASLRALPGTPVIRAAARYLQDEAQACAQSRPATATALDAIADRLLGDYPRVSLNPLSPTTPAGCAE